MGLRNIIIFVGLLFIIWRLLSVLSRRQHNAGGWAGADDYSRFSARRRDRRERFRTSEADAAPEELVACSSCGTMVPMQRALPSDSGARYCCEQCLRDADAGR